MGKIDDYRRILKLNNQLGGYMFDSDEIQRFIKKYEDTESALSDAWSELLSSDYTNITDRSQIINPTSWLEQFGIDTSYDDGQALYDRYFSMLQDLQKQQEASFEEFYNSPEQQVIRDKTAGLNPDILGVSGSQSSSPDLSSVNPMDAMREREALRLQEDANRTARLSSVVNLVSSIANVAALPAQISSLISGKKLTDLQSGSQTLANLSSFEDLVSNEISSRLSDAIDSGIESGKGLDIAEWFGNDENFKNILDIYRPDAGLMYDRSFANVRKRMQKNLAKAYENGKVTADNRYSFASLLADPRVSSDVLIQAAQIQPYMHAKLELEKAAIMYQTKLAEWQTKYQDALSVEDAVAAVNNKNEYDAEYYKNMDAEKMVLWKAYQEEAASIAARMHSAIDKNLYDIYSKYSDNEIGFAAAYVISGGASKSWYEFLTSYEIMTGLNIHDVNDSGDSNGMDFNYPLSIVQQDSTVTWPLHPFTIADYFKNKK